MIDAVANVRPQIGDLCRRFHVRRLDVFGSAARETDFSAESDIDLLVEYESSHSPPTLRDYFHLRDALCGLLGRAVDLTMSGAVRNPYVRADIERSKQSLHGD